MHRLRRTTLGLLLLCAGAQAGEIVDIRWDRDGAFRTVLAVPAGRFAEACAALPAGARVHWSFEADRPLDFNVHYHEESKVGYPTRLAEVPTASGVLPVSSPQDFCWMWTNRSAQPARVTVSLRRD